MSIVCSLPSEDAVSEKEAKHWSKEWKINERDICIENKEFSGFHAEHREFEDDETAHVTCYERTSDGKQKDIRFCAHIETMHEAHKAGNSMTDMYLSSSKMNDASVTRFQTYYNERREKQSNQKSEENTVPRVLTKVQYEGTHAELDPGYRANLIMLGRRHEVRHLNEYFKTNQEMTWKYLQASNLLDPLEAKFLVQKLKEKAFTHPTSVMLTMIPYEEDHGDLLPSEQKVYKQMFQFLHELRNPSVNFAASENWAIRWASRNGLHEIVEFLLAWVGPDKKRVDPTAEKNEAIMLASQNGHAQVVKLLLNWRGPDNERVDPTDQFGEAIIEASDKGHDKVVELLLAWVGPENKGVNVTNQNVFRLACELALRLASKNGHDKVVELLLNWRGPGNKRVDPTAKDNDAIKWAFKNGHDKVVKLLLSWRGPDNKRVERPR